MAFYHTACFVFTIMIVCNAILYPSIFSSIFRHWFGGAPPKPEKEPVPEYPPHMRAGAGPRGAAGRMKPSPGGKPPMSGGAAAGSGGVDPSAFMGQQAQESRGRGMMGTVLPVYAVGIFIYFGYVIYKVFLRDKPSTPSTRSSWGYPEDVSQEGPTLQRQQQENLQRKLAAELKAANYPELKKSDKRAAEAAAAAAAVAAMGDGSTTAAAGSSEEVDMLKKRLEETEKTMQRMMDMMNSMGVAMSQVSQHLSNDKSVPPSMFPDFNNEPNDPTIDEDDMRDIDVDNLSDEEDLLVGDSMDRSSDEENDVSTAKDDMDDDVERRRPKKMNIVDVEVDDYHDDDEEEEEDDGDVDSDDESEEENIGVEDIMKSDTLRRRNVKGGDSAEAIGIEG